MFYIDIISLGGTVILPPMFHSFPSLLFFPSLLKFSMQIPTAPIEKWQPVAKIGRDEIHSVPMISKVGGDASHGSDMGGCAYASTYITVYIG